MSNYSMSNPLSEKKDYFIIAVILIYITVGLYLTPYYVYRLNPDGISYLEIAEKYSRGEWRDAVNGYWGPLYSWLLALLLAIGLKPLLGAKILSLAAGAATIMGARRLIKTFQVSPILQRVFILIASVNILFFALVFITPDLFIVCFLLWYAALIWDVQYGVRLKNALVCGVLGGLAYYSKAYALPFFFIHFTLMNGLHYFNVFHVVEKKRIRKSYLVGISVFLTMSGAWIGLISTKYQRIVIGTAGTFDAPVHLQDFGGGMPFYFTGFVAPPNPSAMSAWEDPSYTAFKLALPSNKSFWQKAKYQISTTAKNGYGFWLIIWGRYNKNIAAFSMYLNMVLILLGLLYIKYARQRIRPWIWLSLAGTFLLYCSGYILLLVDERFFWFLLVLLVLAGILVLDKLSDAVLRQKPWVRILTIAVFILLACYRSVSSLIHIRDSGKDFYKVAQTLKNDYRIHGNIASDKNWDASLIICYFMECRYYGRVAKKNLQKDVAGDLQRFHIDYMLVWEKADPRWLLRELLVDKASLPVKVYSVNEMQQQCLSVKEM